MTAEETKKERKRLRTEIKEKTVGYILAALGLVAGLAWNEAIKALINLFFPAPADDIMLKFLYAVIVTIFIVVITVYLLRFTQKEEAKN